MEGGTFAAAVAAAVCTFWRQSGPPDALGGNDSWKWLSAEFIVSTHCSVHPSLQPKSVWLAFFLLLTIKSSTRQATRNPRRVLENICSAEQLVLSTFSSWIPSQ
eukprot:1157426-Pelagomonas_calceolata.AAC.10